MAPIHQLTTRANQVILSSTTVDLLTVLLALVLTALIATASFFLVRRYRRSKAAGLPFHHSSKRCNHRRLNLTACCQRSSTKSVFVYNEKQELLASTHSPPSTPLPEIRITFPEEVDESGKTQSGRVVVVSVGENGEIGLGPVEENLPAYQKSADGRFQSLDLDRIGGLKEKEIVL